jgi:hypothetical protein
MKTQNATPSPQGVNRDRTARRIAESHGIRAGATRSALAAVVLTAAFAACSPAASTAPSVALPSVNASAAASLGMQAALTALDNVDAAISANETSGGLTAENATSLKTISASIRTALESGDATAAQPAVDEFSAKVDELASGLSGDAGTQLTDAVAALKAALAGG